MIAQQRLALDTQTFAAERKKTLGDAEEFLHEATRRSLIRIGLPQWYGTLVESMLDVFDMTVKMETDQASQTIDDMRREFRREIEESMEKAKRSDNPDAQFALINRWAASVSVNAAVEAATTADPDSRVGMEWITMGDEKVRTSHRDAHGQTVPTGQAFDIGGQEMLYPGQPVGDPSEFLNCRCVVRPAMLGEMASGTTTFANQSDPAENTGDNSVVLVALPRKGDPVLEIASGDHPHITLAYLGVVEPSQFDGILKAAAEVTYHPIIDKVSGRGELGKDQADVLLMDATGSKGLRDLLLADASIADAVATADSFPTWIPHITIGYPDAPRLSDDKPESVTYDRFGLWNGDNVHEYPFNIEPSQEEEAIVAAADEKKVTHVEDPAVTQEQVDALIESIPDEEAMTQVPWHGVLAPEGVPSGDGRQFAAGALTHRHLPIPLKWMPSDKERHDDSVIVGRIDRIFRNKAGMVCGEGVFDTSENAYEAIRQIAHSMLRGVSVDVDAVYGAKELASEEGRDPITEFAESRIASSTLCAIPAFAEAYVALGPWEEPEVEEDVEEDDTAELSGDAGTFEVTVPRKTKDGPGWITEPKATKRITSYWVDGVGAAKIGWGAPGDFARCESQLRKYVTNPKWLAGLCANLHYRALRTWPGQQHAGITASIGAPTLPGLHLVASAGPESAVSADYFRNPALDGPTALQVTDDGRVFGHLAAWGTCHIGVKGVCTTPPVSATNYAYFNTGEIRTDAGPVSVGQITIDGSHAGLELGLRAAAAHYDNTGTAIADVTAGEDEHGIWVSGKLRSTVTAEQLHALRAAALSGDWRRIQGNLEMVAALAVNVPGFPIPRAGLALAASGQEQQSLVAAGIVSHVVVDAITDEVATDPNLDSKLARVNSARRTFRSMRADKARSGIFN